MVISLTKAVQNSVLRRVFKGCAKWRIIGLHIVQKMSKISWIGFFYSFLKKNPLEGLTSKVITVECASLD